MAKPSISGTAHTLPFNKLSPLDFERLCLWLVGREGYARAEHLRLAGSEQGRDVVAWRVVPFLDHSTERIFLRKVGGGYIFIHRLLQEYFASLYEEGTV